MIYDFRIPLTVVFFVFHINDTVDIFQMCIYRSLQVYQRSYSQVGHRVLSDFTLKIVRQMSDKILPGRSESLHSQIVKL